MDISSSPTDAPDDAAPSGRAPEPQPMVTTVRASVNGLLVDLTAAYASRELSSAPPYPPCVYDALPPPLGELTRSMAVAYDRGVVLTSSIVTASTLLPNVRFQYGEKSYSTPLMSLLVARAGNGKGNAQFGIDLATAVDTRIRREAEEAMRQRVTASGGEAEPAPFGVLVPANTSQAAFSDLLAAAKGPVLIADTEIDAYVEANKQDWGGTSHMLRQAFEHEPVRLDRLSRSVNVLRPEVGLFLAGTHGQFSRLFTSPEDGLFSRLLFHTFHAPAVWRSRKPRVRPPGERNPKAIARDGAASLDTLHTALSSRQTPLSVRFTDAQWERHTHVFTAATRWRPTTGLDVMGSVVNRAGLMAWRIAATLSALRAWGVEEKANESEEGTDELGTTAPVRLGDDARSQLTATDLDVEVALALALVHVDHAYRLLLTMPSPDRTGSIKLHSARMLLKVLPEAFSRAEAKQIASDEGISESERTVGSYLSALVKDGALKRKPGENGIYLRTDGRKPEPGVSGEPYESEVDLGWAEEEEGYLL